MARLSKVPGPRKQQKTSKAPSTPSPRSSLAEGEESSSNTEQDHPSKQLRAEYTAALKLQSPTSARSVRFRDEVAEESASLLAKSLSSKSKGLGLPQKQKSTTGRKLKVPLRPLLPTEDDDEKLGQARTGASQLGIYDVVESPQSHSPPRARSGKDESESSAKAKGGARRSTRQRIGVNTYNDKKNAKAGGAILQSAQMEHPRSPAPQKRKGDSEEIEQVSPRSKRSMARHTQNDDVEVAASAKRKPTRSSREVYDSNTEVDAASTKKRSLRKSSKAAGPEAESQEETSKLRRATKSSASGQSNSHSRNKLQVAAEEGLFAPESEDEREEEEEEEEEEEKETETGAQVDSDSDFRNQSNEEEPETSSPTGGNVPDNIYGQALIIADVLEVVDKYDETVRNYWKEDYRTRKQLQQVAASESLRITLRESYKGLATAANDEDATRLQEIIDTALKKMTSITNSLAPDSMKNDPERKRLANQVYAFVIPDFVRVLDSALRSYSAAASAAKDELNIDELLDLVIILECIVDLCDRSRKWKTKIDEGLKVLVIRNSVVAPLKKVLQTFRKQITKLEKRQEEKLRQQKMKSLHRESEEDKRHEEEERELEKKFSRLRLLYACRQSLESNYRLKLHKFNMPNLRARMQQAYSLDANGDPYERVDVFRERPLGSQPPDMEMADYEDDWSKKELLALIEALEACEGKRLWERIFKRYCCYNGPLRTRTVADILKHAKEFQDSQLEPTADEEQELPSWIVDIPDLDLIALL